MILYRGKIFESSMQNQLLEQLESDINKTREHQQLETSWVIDALAILGERIEKGDFDDEIAMFELENRDVHIQTLIELLKKDTLQKKADQQLGQVLNKYTNTQAPTNQKSIQIKLVPLGTLLHIAAGNVDGLPAYSVIEGLLCGNVNILKLPQADQGLSIKIMTKLIEIEPKISDFVYIFDTPSTDIEAIKKMALMVDGIITWGGDATISAVRQFAPLGCHLIEWGHKLSFAYVSGYEDSELDALAKHIIVSKQLLCSSCQTILLDTSDIEEAEAFCLTFLNHFENAFKKYAHLSLAEQAEITLQQYNSILVAILETQDSQDYKSEHCSITLSSDHKLKPSSLFTQINVQMVPQPHLFQCLRNTKGYLQTAGLICHTKKRDFLTELLIKAGVTRVTHAGDMSETFYGEAHDGEYPLARYIRVINCEL